MELSLKNFRSQINRRVVERGYTYFRDGLVEELARSGNGVFTAVVRGSDNYDVLIELQEDAVKRFTCDCPYDGPVCKHVAATLFSIMDFGELPVSIESAAHSTKQVGSQVDNVIDECPEKALRTFLKEYSRKNASFVTELLNAFPDPEISDTVYRKQLKKLLLKVSDGDGFIGWDAAQRMAKDLDRLTHLAEQHREKNEWQAVVAICTVLMEELIEAISYADDSNGILGGSIEISSNLLAEVARSGDSVARDQLWSFCVLNYEGEIFEGWDWHTNMLELMLELADSPSRIEQLREFLTDSSASDYEEEEREYLYYRLLQKNGESEAALLFLEKHLSNPSLRKQLILDLIVRKDFETAIQIAEDGIATDRKNKPGLVKRRMDIQLEIYLAQGRVEKVVELSRMLFLDGFLRERDYYALLKAHTDPENWSETVDSLAKALSVSDWSRAADIYVRENKHQQLLDFVSSKKDLGALTIYDRQLAGNYPNELAQLYACELPKFVEVNASRNYYRQACFILQRIGKLGREDLVTELTDQLRKQYPTRRALQEELNMLRPNSGKS